MKALALIARWLLTGHRPPGTLLAWYLAACISLPASAQTIFENDFETGNAGAWSAVVPADTQAPGLEITEPLAGPSDNPTPLVVVMYSDALIGVDLSTLAITLDGDDLLASCVIASDRAICEPAGALAEGEHTIAASIRDRAGLAANDEVTFSVVPPIPDTTPPVITVLSPGTTFFGETVDLEITFVDPIDATGIPPAPTTGIDLLSLTLTLDGVPVSGCAIGSGTALCSGVAIAAGRHTLAVSVADLAGNRADATHPFVSAAAPPDTTPPDLALEMPLPEIAGDATPAIRLAYSDSGAGIDPASLEIRVDGESLDVGTCQVTSDDASCESPALAAGTHTIEATIADHASNGTTRDFSFTLRLDLPITIDSPVEGLLTTEDVVTVRGTVVSDADAVEVGGVMAVIAGDQFEAVDVPLHEGANTLTATARSADGGIGVATRSVVRDTVAPRVVIVTPVNISTPGAAVRTTAAQIDIAGEIRDADSSLIATQDLTVMANGVAAQVTNGSFLVEAFLLQPGRNVIEITCTDMAGNTGSSVLTVDFVADAATRIEPLLGNGQRAPLGSTLAHPLVVRLTDALGRPLPGRDVVFRTSRGDGTLSAPPLAGRTITVLSDENGLAQARFAVGTRAGSGNHEVVVTSLGIPGEVVFCASAESGPPARIVPVAGNQQIDTRSGAVGEPLTKPLLVQVFDAFGNPVAGTDVDFAVIDGDGQVAGAATVTRVTDVEGKASTPFTLGPLAGSNSNYVEASLPGQPTAPASFVISSLVAGAEAETVLRGQVLGPNDAPIPGATVRVADTSLETVTDLGGRFGLVGMPAGAQSLEIDGSTVTLPGEWVDLRYEIEVVSGQDNALGTPIRLLPLDMASARMVGGAEDVTLSLLGVPGAELTVFAGSATFPDGASVGELTVTQVHSDKVPMVPPMGSDFMLAWTIQPPGVRFDPPARLSIPNNSLAPGSVVDIFSFDHDVGEFLSIGTASVSEDGTQIVSDPGFGVVKTGWHGCLPPPPPTGNACNPGACQRCEDNRPVPACDRCSTCSCSGTDGSCSAEGSTCSPRIPGVVEIAWGVRIDRAFVPVGESITLRAGLSEGNCTRGPFKWFVDGEMVLEGPATLTHTFEEPADEHTVRVEVGCKECSTIPPVSDDMPVVAVDLEEINVLSGGENLDDGPATPEDTNVGAAIFGGGEMIVEAVLLPIGAVEPADLPPSFVSWTGGEALSEDQADQIFRRVPKDVPREDDLIATVGRTSRTMLAYVIGAEPGRFTPENGTNGSSFPDNMQSWASQGFSPGLDPTHPGFGDFKSRSEMEFEVVPAGFSAAGAAGLFDTEGVCFHLERDVQSRLYFHDSDGWEEFVFDDGSNSGWAPDDVGDGPEDDNPFDGGGRIYNRDAPGVQPAPGRDGIVFKNNFREHVSCLLAPGQSCPFGTEGYVPCQTDYLYWYNFRGVIKIGDVWQDDPSFENVIAPGNVFWGTLPESSHVEITTTTVPNGTQDQPYNATLASASGDPPIAWSLERGTLPPGMSLGAVGTIQGTPTEAGSFTFDVQARDSNTPPGTDVQTLTLTIDPPQQGIP